METGQILPEDFVTIETGKQDMVTKHFKHAENVHKFYKGKTHYKVRFISVFRIFFKRTQVVLNINGFRVLLCFLFST